MTVMALCVDGMLFVTVLFLKRMKLQMMHGNADFWMPRVKLGYNDRRLLIAFKPFAGTFFLHAS